MSKKLKINEGQTSFLGMFTSSKTSKTKKEKKPVTKKKEKRKGIFQMSFMNFFNEKEEAPVNEVTTGESEEIVGNVALSVLNIMNTAKNTIKETEDIAIDDISVDVADAIMDTAKSLQYESPEGVENYRLEEETSVSESKLYIGNIEAIKMVKKLGDKFANKIQQSVIAKFAGFGKLSKFFKSGTQEAEELHQLLDEEEFSSAKRTTLTAFYTPKFVIDAMYAALRRLGFSGGKVLEPSCGSGRFIGAIPEDMECQITAIELDTITSKIAKKLYPKANVIHSGFEKINIPNDYFDLAISNVPFGNLKIYDSEYDALYHKGFSIHEYFLAKMLDKVHAGGFVAIVLSTYFMDTLNSAKRYYIAQRAQLLGAVRLPEGTFGETNASCDILFFKKRAELEANPKDDWIEISKFGKGIEKNEKFSKEIFDQFYNEVGLGYYYLRKDKTSHINDYFLTNPNNILGNISFMHDQYGKDAVVYLDVSDNLQADLRQILTDTLPTNAYECRPVEFIEGSKTLPENVKPYTFYMYNNRLFYANGDIPMPKEDNQAEIINLLKMKVVLTNLLTAQKEGIAAGKSEDYWREQLNARYDKFVAKYGRINSKNVSNVFGEDISYPMLQSLERVDKNFIKKAEIMEEKTTYVDHKMYEAEKNVESALIKSMRYFAKVNLPYMEKILGMEKGEVISKLKGKIYLNPETNEYETSEEYLSGNIRKKLQIASDKAVRNKALEENVEALHSAMPEEVLPCDIEIALGAKWVPSEIYLDFAKSVIADGRTDGNIRIFYSEKTVTFKITYNNNTVRNNASIITQWGIKGSDVEKTGYQLLEDCLNNTDTKVYMPGTKNGKDIRVIDKTATKEAQLKQNEMRAAFTEWVTKDEHRMEYLASIYNVRFNSFVVRQYDGSFLEFHGMNPKIVLKKHQVNAVARILLHGNTLLAHMVGAGKTYTIIAAAMEGKRLGLFNKPLVVVPKHLVAQWQNDWMELYPSANILCTDEKSFAKKNRAKFISMIAMNKYDGVIMSYEQFSNITLSDTLQAEYLEKDILEMQQYLSNLTDDDGSMYYTIKEIEKQISNLENRLEAINTKINAKKELIDFELLGIDKLFVDEAHFYKNLRITTRLGRVKGVQTSAALKTDRFYSIVRYMNDTYKEKAIVFATATPISNSMTELYTMMKYLEPSVLEDLGCRQFDEWATSFGKIETQLELDPNGSTFRSVQKFSKFFNLPELIVAFHQIADVKLADDIDVPLPTVQNITCENELSEYQDKFMQDLVTRSEIIRNGGVDPSVDNMLLVTGDGKKLSIDPRILDSTIEVDDKKSKLELICKNVYKEYVESKNIKGTQMIFLDCSTPNKNSDWTMYQAIRENLISKGIKGEEIVFIHDANTKEKKRRLFSKMNEGEVRVLIGSTTKMGTGVNAQKRIVAIHHADVPWRPADLEQREGRGIRRGNINTEVRIYRYITKGSFDARAWQTIEDKQKFIGALMHGHKNIGREIDGDLFDAATLSYGEIKACALKDPRIKTYFELENELNVLRVKRSNEKHQIHSLHTKLEFLPEKIKNQQEYLTKITTFKDIVEAKYKEFAVVDGEKQFCCIINDVAYNKRTEAADALSKALKKLPYDGRKQVVGEYKGVEIIATYNSFMNYYSIGLGAQIDGKYFVVYTNDDIYSTKLKHSIFIKIDNIFGRIPDLIEKGRLRLKQSEDALISVKEQYNKVTGQDSVDRLYQIKEAEFKKLGEALHIGENINETAGLEE